MLAELCLQARAERSGLNQRGARDLVHLEHAIQRAQVDRHHTVVSRADVRADPADDRCASAEWDRRHALARAPFEHTLQIALVAWVNDKVGGMIEAPAKPPYNVRVGLAQRVRRACIRIPGTDLRQRGRGGDARRRQRHRLQRNRLLDLGERHAQTLAQLGGRGANLRRGRLLILIAPTPVLAPTGGLHEDRVYCRSVTEHHLNKRQARAQRHNMSWSPRTEASPNSLAPVCPPNRRRQAPSCPRSSLADRGRLSR
jgi:hypothetical protein